MRPLTERDVRFWISWTAAHGLSLATLIWVAVYLTNGVLLNQLWIVGLTLFVGFVSMSLLQQAIISWYGCSAWFWSLSSLVAWMAMSVFGTYGEELVLAFVGRNILFDDFATEWGMLIVPIFIGAVFGGIQLWGCEELRRRGWIWPTANAVGFAAVVIILPFQRNYATHVRIAAYLVALAAGTAYGVITGYAVLVAQKRSTCS